MEVLLFAILLAGLVLAIRHLRESLEASKKTTYRRIRVEATTADMPERRIPLKQQVRQKPSPEIIKTVSGRKFWEEGYETGVCPDISSSVPRWFVDLRSQGKIRVNCLTQATIYLRNDGKLYHVQKAYCAGDIEPIWDAFESDVERLGFIRSSLKRDKVSSNSEEIWECCEYTPDADCSETDNIWKVAAAARRTGRFLYTGKRKTAKSYLEELSSEAPWIYSKKFDQSTSEYEKRYQEKIKQIECERQERERDRAKNAQYIKFNIGNKETNYYQALEIEKTASPEEIKRAYWAKAKTCHPDLNPNNKEAEEEFKLLSIAYAELMSLYDN